MTHSLLTFPQPLADDSEDVSDALDTGFVLWKAGEHADALRWLRRARDFADEIGNDRRALDLARIAADLTTHTSMPPAVTESTTDTTTSSTTNCSRPLTGAPIVSDPVAYDVPPPPPPPPPWESNDDAPLTAEPQVVTPIADTAQCVQANERIAQQETGLVSFAIRIAAVESDGSLRVVPLTQATTDGSTNQALLVVSETLWSRLNGH
jgi:hypothetical protein